MIFQELQIGDYFKSPRYEDTEVYMKSECYIEGSTNAVCVMDEIIGACVRGWGARLEWDDEVILIERVADIPKIEREFIIEDGKEYLIIDGEKHPVERDPVNPHRIKRLTPLTKKEIVIHKEIIRRVENEIPPKRGYNV